MHEVLVNRLGGLRLPRKSVVRLTDRPDMTLNVYCGRKTTNQQQHKQVLVLFRKLAYGGQPSSRLNLPMAATGLKLPFSITNRAYKRPL